MKEMAGNVRRDPIQPFREPVRGLERLRRHGLRLTFEAKCAIFS